MKKSLYTSPFSLVLLAIAFVYFTAIVYISLFGGFTFDHPVKVDASDPAKLILILLGVLLILAAYWSYSLAPPDDVPMVEIEYTRTAHKAALVLIIVIGVSLRLWAFGQGAQSGHYHPDEPKHVEAVKKFIQGEYTFDIDDFMHNRYVAGYPFFSMHLTKAAYKAAKKANEFAGFGLWDDRIGGDYNRRISMTGRAINAVVSAMMIYIIYHLGARIGGAGIGLMAAMLLALSLPHIHMSKYLNSDIPMSLFALLAAYYATLNMHGERRRNYIMFGLAAGLAAACKYNGVLVFAYLVFLAAALNPRIAKIAEFIPRFVLALSVSILTFIVTNANIMTDPAKAMTAIKNTMDLSRYTMVEDRTLATRISVLINEFDFHWFAFSGIFKPVPVWLAAALILAALVYRTRVTIAMVLSALVVFAYGKYSMPVSVSYHYFNVFALFLTAMAIGAVELRRLVGNKAAIAVASVLVLGLTYQTTQDTSMWTLPNHTAELDSWLEENIDYKDPAAKEIYREGRHEHGPQSKEISERIIGHFHYGTKEQAVSLHRDIHIFVWLDMDKPPSLFPLVRFPAKGRDRIIYSQYPDFAATAKAVTTAGKDFYVTRRLLVNERPERLMVWVKNFSNEKNKIELYAGGKIIRKTLSGMESVLLEIDSPRRSFLHFGNFINLCMESVEKAGWVVASNKKEMGDLLRLSGRNDEAVKAYLDSGDTAGLLRALQISKSAGEKKAVMEKLSGKAPWVFDGPELSGSGLWMKAAGYTDRIFASKLTRPVPYRVSQSEKTEFAERRAGENEKRTGYTISDGGILYGPYISLLEGEYTFSAAVKPGPGLESFSFDVVTNSGADTIASVEFTSEDIAALAGGRMRVTFAVNSPMAGNIEFRFHKVRGGAVDVHDAKITAENLLTLKKLAGNARQ